jgi:glycosyltransferase involved in cell wall biosynthesis
MTQNCLVSICVPTYHAHGEQDRILKRLIKSVREQNYPNIELVISDQDAVPEDGRKRYAFQDGKINVKYIAYDGPQTSAHNTNNAILNASGDYVMILNHDDFLYHDNAIGNMVTLLENQKAGWVATACLHTDAHETVIDRPHCPWWPGEKSLVEGVNTIGCPSVVMFRRDLGLECTTGLALCMDCSMWLDLYRKAGPPAILANVSVVVRMWPMQLSNQINYAQSLEDDKVKLRKKYGYT